MPADIHHKIYVLPKFSPGRYRAFMTSLNNALGFETSDKARFRLHVLKLLSASGWKAVHLAFPNISRPTVYRWKKDFEASGKKLSSLVPKSTRPRVCGTVQPDYQGRVCDLQRRCFNDRRV